MIHLVVCLIKGLISDNFAIANIAITNLFQFLFLFMLIRLFKDYCIETNYFLFIFKLYYVINEKENF